MESLSDLKRTCYCGEVTEEWTGRIVTVMGWVEGRRDLGGLVFLDLRDREGIIQAVITPDRSQAMDQAKEVRLEYVVAATGEVAPRSAEAVNPSMKTGQVEIRVTELRLLSRAQALPFSVSDPQASEETRLRYRFLDLRRLELQRNLRLRHRAAASVRRYLDDQGFVEIETPILTRSTPEGARDYLVPSRVHPGQFYALPQSPQIFKQILMASGFDRYYQIVRCFRDEDLRADRQPEFTQIDLEMSFVTPETVFEVVEGMLQGVFSIVGIQAPRPFPRLGYDQAMERFGSDRPDTRFGLELCDLEAAFQGSSFQVFASILAQGGTVRGLTLPGKSDLSRKRISQLEEVVKRYGAKGLAWIKRTESGLKSSLPKSLPASELEGAADAAQLRQGDVVLLVAGERKTALESLGALRLHVAEEEQLVPDDRYEFLWVEDFPLLEWDGDEERWAALHHPFTSPRDEDLEILASRPGEVRSKAYDVVLNGLEIGGGSIRIHREDIQRRVFETMGIDEEEARSRFGFLLEALSYGAPPHGGIALGLDRIAMLLAKASSLREVIAFPKTARGTDLMCGAPSGVESGQLEELGIALLREEAAASE